MRTVWLLCLLLSLFASCEAIQPLPTFSNPNVNLSYFQNLLDKGYSPDHELEGEPLLCLAIQGHSFLAAKFLINKEASINIQNRDGFTPLHIATILGRADIVKYLLDRGASVLIEDIYGKRPLSYAAKISRADIVDLIAMCDVYTDHRDKKGNAAIHEAVVSGSTEVVEQLIHYSSSIDLEGENCDTPLLLAVRSGNKEMVGFLLKHSADTNLYNIDRVTPLHEAVRLRDIDIVKLLLKSKLDLNARIASTGDTPLHLAIENGSEDDSVTLYLVTHLIARGARIDVRNNMGRTPLHFAAVKGNRDVVELFLDLKVYQKTRDKYGKTALDLAISCYIGETHNKHLRSVIRLLGTDLVPAITM